MKKWLCFLVGLIPFLLGYIMNRAMMAFPAVSFPYGAIGLISLIAWFGLGMTTRRLVDSDGEALALVHLAGVLDLLLLLFQEVIQGHYWVNKIGVATQLFYLPVVNIAAKFTAFSPRLYWTYVSGLVLMVAAFSLGRFVGKRST